MNFILRRPVAHASAFQVLQRLSCLEDFGGPFPLKINGSWVFRSLKWIWNLQPRDTEKQPSLNIRLKLLLSHQHCHDPTECCCVKVLLISLPFFFFSVYIMLRDNCREINLFAGLLQMVGKFLWRRGRMQRISAVGSWGWPGLPAELSSYLLSHSWVQAATLHGRMRGSSLCLSRLAHSCVAPLPCNFVVKWNDSGSHTNTQGSQQIQKSSLNGQNLKYRGEMPHTKELIGARFNVQRREAAHQRAHTNLWGY